MTHPVPVYRPVRDGEWTTILCRCGAQVTRYRREMPDDRRAKRNHRCPQPRSAA